MKKLIVVGALALLLTPLVAISETFNYRFDVRLGLGKIGEMQIAANNNGNGYSTIGILRTTGLVGALYDVRYELNSSGRVTESGVLLPVLHTSMSDEQNNISNVEINYSGDRVAAVTYSPRKSVPSNATSHRETLDPMALIYQLIRPGNASEVCTGRFRLFDGQAAMTVTFSNVEHRNNGNVECDVKYENTGKQNGVAPSGLVFELGGDGLMHIERFRALTSIGTLNVVLK